MKLLVNNYTFDALAKTITFSNAYLLSQMLLVTNVTTNQIIYNFAAPGFGGSVVGKVLTLDFDTAAMNNGDSLQIFVDVEDVAPAESASLLQRILNALMAPLGYDKSISRSRVTAVVESGTVTTIGTVTTVAAVNNISTVDSLPGRLLINGSNAAAWALTVRNRIT